MGLFLDMLGIAGMPNSAIEQALRQALASFKLQLIEDPSAIHGHNHLILSPTVSNKTVVVHDGDFSHWHEVAITLSRSLDTPIFHFHIHDGDLWMYTLYVQGLEIDAFNPVPDCWGDIDEHERQRYKGNPQIICEHWPNVAPDSIRRYLLRWTQHNSGRKAYPDDTFHYGDEWQVTDFMGKLELEYPIAADESVKGRVFRVLPSENKEQPKAS